MMILLSACSAESTAAARAATIFHCAGDRSFSVERDSKTAIVVYSDVRYELPRRKSSIGERYATSGTTLIVDGELAAFVSGSVMDLNFCRAEAAGRNGEEARAHRPRVSSDRDPS